MCGGLHRLRCVRKSSAGLLWNAIIQGSQGEYTEGVGFLSSSPIVGFRVGSREGYPLLFPLFLLMPELLAAENAQTSEKRNP